MGKIFTMGHVVSFGLGIVFIMFVWPMLLGLFSKKSG